VNSHNHKLHVVVIGAGFTGLAAAYEIARENIGVTALEKSTDIGGLASSFKTKGRKLETFYHHWFKSNRHAMDLVNGLGCRDLVLSIPTKTGV
jgi:protoporphyrinogen oxidase